MIDVTGLVALLDSGEGTVVIDLARSIDFREGHIPGALWGVRTRLGALKPQLGRRRSTWWSPRPTGSPRGSRWRR